MRFLIVLLIVGAVALDERDWIKVYPGAFPEALCDQFTAYLDTADKSVVGVHDADYRRSLQLSFNNLPPSATQTFVAALKPYFERYKAEVRHERNLYWASGMEIPSILKYQPTGKDKFELHSDAWNIPSALRLVSVIVYLNDVEAGGETIFPNQDMIVQPRKGSIVFFPSFLTYPHRAAPPLVASKYAIVTWMCYGGATPGQPFYHTIPF